MAPVSLEEQFRGCVEAFVARDYAVAAPRLMAMIERDGPTLALLQMLLISLQRSEQAQLLEQVAVQVPEISKDVPWQRTLLDLTLGRGDPRAAATQSEDEKQMGQVLYYFGAHLLTTGRTAAARDVLLQCVQLQAPGLETYLAVQELKFIDAQPPAAPAAEDPSAPIYALIQRGTTHRTHGRLAEAESCWRQALELTRRAVPPDPRLLAGALNNLALLHHDQGQLAESESLYRQVLEQLLSLPDRDETDVASVRNNLGRLLQSAGRFRESEAQLREALESHRRRLGDRHLETAKTAGNLGLLYYDMGLYGRAEPLYRESLEVRRELLPADHPELAESLQNLGELYRVQGRLDLAEALLTQALGVWRAGVGEEHPSVGHTLNNLALVCMSRRDHPRAEELYRQALAIKQKVLGERHPDVATSLDTLAGLYIATGRHDEAERLCRQALEMRRTLLGETHPDVAFSLNNLALIQAATGRHEEALDSLRESSAVDDGLIGQAFAAASEAERLAFLGHLRHRFHVLLSLVVRHLADRPRAVRLALDLVLRRKGLAAEALAAQRDALVSGRYPQLQPAFAELARLRQEIGRRTLAGPAAGESPDQHSAALARGREERQQIEERLAREVPEIGLEQRLRQADAAHVARALPAESALVELVRLDPFDFQASAPLPARYVALVLRAGEPDAAVLLDLGEAEPLDAAVAALREAITSEVEDGDPPAAQDLRLRLFEPLLPALAGRTRVLVSPDADLARLPFEVLPLADGARVIDRYSLGYVSSGRDVLRFGAPLAGAAAAPLVAADPDFDAAGDATPPGSGRRDLEGLAPADRLPGTRGEGEQVAALLGVPPMLGGDVLEERVRSVRSPRILHLATHGFFLPDQRVENPLLRSGLLLAGFNTWLAGGALPPSAGDGMLNGEDVAGLDLIDSELAVLSACETGLGEVRVGEGVFGLRRAFVLAGARTLVMSLWKVPDDETRELMVDFYRRVLSGQPRAESLRQAQLAVKARQPDPFYWGAFICQGDPGPLSST